MEADIRNDCLGVDWTAVSATLRRVGMTHHPPELHQKAFEASFCVAFAYSAGQMIGFGRAISDGAYQAAIYDMAVIPEYQGQGIGKAILKSLLARVPQCNVILYASPGKEAFYQSLGFRKMKTGMALFQQSAAMADKGLTE